MHYFIAIVVVVIVGISLHFAKEARSQDVSYVPIGTIKLCTLADEGGRSAIDDYGETVSFTLHSSEEGVSYSLAQNKNTGSWTFYETHVEGMICLIAAYAPERNRALPINSADSAEGH